MRLSIVNLCRLLHQAIRPRGSVLLPPPVPTALPLTCPRRLRQRPPPSGQGPEQNHHRGQLHPRLCIQHYQWDSHSQFLRPKVRLRAPNSRKSRVGIRTIASHIIKHLLIHSLQINILKFIIAPESSMDPSQQDTVAAGQALDDVRDKINKMFPLTSLIWQQQSVDQDVSMHSRSGLPQTVSYQCAD